MVLNKNKKERVIFTGSNGFPFGSAEVQRQLQLANALLEEGFDVTILNRRGLHSKYIAQREGISSSSYFNGIQYIYCSALPYRSDVFMIRNSFKILGYFSELFLIIYFRVFKNAKFLFNNSINLQKLKYYHFISRFLGLQLIYDYVEMMSSLEDNNIEVLDLENKNFDNQFFKYTDKIITISTFLDNYIRKITPNVLGLKIPPIIDFSVFDKVVEINNDKPYFLYCGQANYVENIKFVINSFKRTDFVNNQFSLVFIIYGDVNAIEYVKQLKIESKFPKNIKILTSLSYCDLISYYKTARALLIPIQEHLQDQARFPYKICEYLASKRPIVSSKVPLIKEYFTDNENILAAKINDPNDFANKLSLLMENGSFADRIGKNGYLLGKKVFNYKTYSKDLKKLLKK